MEIAAPNAQDLLARPGVHATDRGPRLATLTRVRARYGSQPKSGSSFSTASMRALHSGQWLESSA